MFFDYEVSMFVGKSNKYEMIKILQNKHTYSYESHSSCF
jgi:hypothetical protein